MREDDAIRSTCWTWIGKTISLMIQKGSRLMLEVGMSLSLKEMSCFENKKLDIIGCWQVTQILASEKLDLMGRWQVTQMLVSSMHDPTTLKTHEFLNKSFLHFQSLFTAGQRK